MKSQRSEPPQSSKLAHRVTKSKLQEVADEFMVLQNTIEYLIRQLACQDPEDKGKEYLIAAEPR